MTTPAERPIYQITPTIRVVDTGREWVIQTTSRAFREWTDRAYLTERALLHVELKRLIGKGAPRDGLEQHVEKDVRKWLKRLPGRHPARECTAANSTPTVLDTLEAMGSEIHTSYDLRDDLPLIVQHGPLKYRDRWNARFDC
ncbi:MAG: hypothetical protein ACTHOP_25245 [Mesorhizobium sp.]